MAANERGGSQTTARNGREVSQDLRNDTSPISGDRVRRRRMGRVDGLGHLGWSFQGAPAFRIMD